MFEASLSCEVSDVEEYAEDHHHDKRQDKDAKTFRKDFHHHDDVDVVQREG
jgi:hypothetical protein